MRKDDARKLDHATLEALRIRAVALVEKGQSPEVVGKALGLNRTTIYDWLALYRRGGERAACAGTSSEAYGAATELDLRHGDAKESYAVEV